MKTCIVLNRFEERRVERRAGVPHPCAPEVQGVGQTRAGALVGELLNQRELVEP